MVSHETNTFSPISTDRGQFEARDLRYGGEILEAYRDTGTCLGGMIDGAAAARLQDLSARRHGRARARGGPAAGRRGRRAPAAHRRLPPAADAAAHRGPSHRAGPDAPALRSGRRDGAATGRDLDLGVRGVPAGRP